MRKQHVDFYEARSDMPGNPGDDGRDCLVFLSDDEDLYEIDELLDGSGSHPIEELDFGPDDERVAKSVDAVSSVSEYNQIRKRHFGGSELARMYEGCKVETLFMSMRDALTDSETRKWLREEIFLKVFFLLPYAVKKNYRIASPLFNDAIQNMSHMVLIAIEKFNPCMGCKFTSYLAGYLQSAMTRTFRDTNVVSVPTGRRKLLKEMRAECGPCPSEIVSYTGIEYDSNSCAGSRKINFEELTHNRELVEWLEEATSREAEILTEDERLIVILHYGLFGHERKSYREIAEIRKRSGKSRSFSRISQIHAKALEKLKKCFSDRNIEEF